MKVPVKLIAFGFLIGLSKLIWMLLFSISGFKFIDFFQISNIGATISIILSLPFILFILSFPITYALAAVLSTSAKRGEIYATIFAPLIISDILIVLISPSILNYIVLEIFYLISILALVENARVKFLELRKFVLPRTAISSVSSATIVLGLGLFIYSSVLIMPLQEDIFKDFESNLLGIFSGEGSSNELIDMSLDVYIGAQENTANAIIALPSFTAMLQKEDPDVKAFAAELVAFEKNLSSAEYRAGLKQELEANWEEGLPAKSEGLAFDLIEREFPLFGIFKDFFWLIASMFLLSFFFLIANVIIKPLSALYSVVIGGAIMLGKKAKEEISKTE
ncbi:MAG: hypothetical protein ABID38_05220 [Candidatus Diapherotrites archaeon]